MDYSLEVLAAEIAAMREEIASLRDQLDKAKARPALERKMLFANCKYNDVGVAREALGPLADGVNLNHYRATIEDWSDSTGKMRTERGWLATWRTFIRRDAASGKLARVNVYR